MIFIVLNTKLLCNYFILLFWSMREVWLLPGFWSKMWKVIRLFMSRLLKGKLSNRKYKNRAMLPLFYCIFSDIFRKKNPKLCHKLNFSNHFIFLTWWFTLLIFQTLIIWSHRILSLKYLRSKTQGCKDIGFRTSEFVAKTRFLSVQVACCDHIVLISQTDNIILARFH